MFTRQKELLQWLVGGVTTAALITGVSWLSEHEQLFPAGTSASAATPDSSRQPASESTDTSKMKILKPHNPTDEPQGKGGGHLSISFTPSAGAVVGDLNLVATVKASMDLADLHYEWLLPDGVTLTKGSPTGDLGTLAEGQETTIEASFSAPQSENRQVHLQVYRLVDGEKMGQVVQYNTLDQPAIEKSMLSKRERLESDRSPASQKPKMME